jgi:hypothetical protein
MRALALVVSGLLVCSCGPSDQVRPATAILEAGERTRMMFGPQATVSTASFGVTESDGAIVCGEAHIAGMFNRAEAEVAYVYFPESGHYFVMPVLEEARRVCFDKTAEYLAFEPNSLLGD